MKINYTFFVVLGLLLTFRSFSVFAQVGINDDSTLPNSSAMLDVKSTSKGLLPPRMTHAQMNSIVSPANGLIIYCTDCGNSENGALAMFMSGAWYMFAPSCIGPLFPAEGTHVPSVTQITWNWNTVAYATGYKWNTTNNYATAADMLTATTKTETGLTCNTPYTRYVWAYNGCGNSTPVTLNQSTLSCSTMGIPCPGLAIVSYGGQTYNTVQIGTQCWFKENLNIGTRINGLQEQTNNSTIEKYCYNDLESNCTIYGGLYQWAEMVQYLNGATNTTSWNPIPTGYVQGICPSGWHIPTDAEWTTATTFLGGESVAGGKMKSTGTIQAGTGLWYTPNTGATNESGFMAVPAGSRSFNGAFYDFGNYGYWWSSSENTAGNAWFRYMTYYGSNVNRSNSYDDGKNYGFSVRCLQN